jgi:Mycothiol maleylpyruvate isomerase N-terminal domain
MATGAEGTTFPRPPVEPARRPGYHPGMRRPSPTALAAWRRAAIARMTRSRAATLALLARLPRERLERPGTRDAWSIRDVLAHIAAWEEEGTRRLALIARGRGDRIVWYETLAEVDRFNARVVRQARRLSLPRLLARLVRARAGLIRALRRVPPPALADPSHGLPVTTWMREFAWTHEQEHRAEIRAESRRR